MTGFFDTHCHLDFDVFAPDREQVIQRAIKHGVNAFAIPGVTRSQWPRLLSLFSQEQVYEENVSGRKSRYYLGFGLHPYFIDQHVPADLMHLEHYLQSHPHTFVGEIGLDASKPFLTLQRLYFEAQLKLAVTYQRPVVLHHRKSLDSMLPMIKSARAKGLPGGLVHAFSGSLQQAKVWVELGFKLGLGGVITYPRAQKTREVVATLPLEAFVLETDSPDMPLKGFQGQRNEPARIIEVFRTLVDLRQKRHPNESEAQIQSTVLANSQSLFL